MDENTNTNSPKKYSDLITTILIIIAFGCGAFGVYRLIPNKIDKLISRVDEINVKVNKNIDSCNVLIEESKTLVTERNEIMNQIQEVLKQKSTTGTSIVTAQVNSSVKTPESNLENQSINNVPFNSSN